MAGRRTYKQVCGLATALDLVGERWTLLLVRDLAFGARRYGELLEGLPGIGEGLLAQRLRHLEREGIVRRTFSPDAGAVVYELTEDGRELFEAIVPLTKWGIKRVPPLEDPSDARADWVAIAIRSRLDPAKTHGVHEQYEMRVDDEPYTITADDGDLAVERGAADDPAVRITLDMATLLELGLGMLRLRDARDSGRTAVEGDDDARARWTRLLRGFR